MGTVLSDNVCIVSTPSLSCGTGTVVVGNQCVASDDVGPGDACVPALEAGLSALPIVKKEYGSFAAVALTAFNGGVRVYWAGYETAMTLSYADVSLTGSIGTPKAMTAPGDIFKLRAASNNVASVLLTHGLSGEGGDHLYVTNVSGDEVARVAAPSDAIALPSSANGFLVVGARAVVLLSNAGVLASPVEVVPSTATISDAVTINADTVAVVYSDTASPGRAYLKLIDFAGNELRSPASLFAEETPGLSPHGMRFAEGRLAITLDIVDMAHYLYATSMVVCDASSFACNQAQMLDRSQSMSSIVYPGRYFMHAYSTVVTDRFGRPQANSAGVWHQLVVPALAVAQTDSLLALDDKRIAVASIVSAMQTVDHQAAVQLSFASCP